MKKIATLLSVCALAATLSACVCVTARETNIAVPNQTCPKSKVKNDKCCASLKFDNAQFYDKDGKFNTEAAKDAVLKLLKFHNFPINEKTRGQLWVSDYGTGKFTEVGLAAIMVRNHEKNDGKGLYMFQPLFLLPGQMLPEHWHKKPATDMPAKMEGWYVLGGSTYTVGEGTDNLTQFPEIKIPASHSTPVTAKHATKLNPGEWNELGRELEHHWQQAGPQGAVIIEVANVHTNSCVEHLVPAIDKHFSGK
ncbi:MAG: D-lyxose/D-mannose family sugar isomerase [Puniceicoccales bacterium]|jgi:D-lyxose ketol-isomerase|nr:D-lyxose/D-mannose family sugar isomerase [Puniceicoccales bacterium]